MSTTSSSEDGKFYRIYDGFKTLQLNKMYYGSRLERLRTYNLVMEWVILGGASSSGIAGLAVLQQTQYGRVCWGILSAISVVLALTKPLLKLTDRITIYAKLYGEYASGAEKVKQIVDDIQADHLITPARMKTFEEVRKRVGELSGLGDAVPNKSLVLNLQNSVNEQINIELLWLPSDESTELLPTDSASDRKSRPSAFIR